MWRSFRASRKQRQRKRQRNLDTRRRKTQTVHANMRKHIKRYGVIRYGDKQLTCPLPEYLQPHQGNKRYY